MIEHIRPGKIQEKEMQTELAKLEMAQALRQGNVYEVMKKLPSGITRVDFEDYMKKQWTTWKSQIIQDYQVYENDASVPGPKMQDFTPTNDWAKMSQEEGREFLKSMAMSLSKGLYKAEKVATEEAGTSTDSQSQSSASPDELSNMAQNTLDEWQNFTGEMWNSIFDSQMVQDMQSKMADVQREAQRIISLAKSGQIDVEYVLLALAKVNVTKNGVLMTWLGKKAFATNETMNNIANDLSKIPSSDPQYFGALQTAQAKTRDGSFQMQMLVSDMQKVTQDVAGVMEQIQGQISEINRTKREMITRVAAQ